MKNNFVIDASAWIEYFNGTDKGSKIKLIIESKSNKIFTNLITISELAIYFEKRSFDFIEPKKIIISFSQIYTPNFDFAEEAGKFTANIRRSNSKIGLADIYVFLTAQKLKGKLITCDNDFRKLKDVTIIE